MFRLALIQSCWHKETVDQFKNGFSQRIAELVACEIDYFEAPGVVEIPLLTKLCAADNTPNGPYDAIIVTGLIVDHGVYRHEFVAQSVMDLIMRIQVDKEIPVIYGILTAQDFMSEGRDKFYFDHFATKGLESANACAKTLDTVARLKPA